MPTLAQLTAYHALPDDLVSRLDEVAHLEFHRLCVDSRQVQQGDIFVLLKSQNPKAVIDYSAIQSYLDALADKAVCVLSQIPRGDLVTNLPFVYVPDIRLYLGELVGASLQAVKAMELPTIIATTGTNGKTTISQLTAQLISHTGKKVAVMGTAGNGVLDNGVLSLSPATHTTPEVVQLQQAVYEFANQGVQVLSLEASSHGLHQHRLQGLPITVAIFSNLSRDHLDYHQDMDEYATAKARLFDQSYFRMLKYAIINSDDEFAPVMINKAKQMADKLTIWTYSLTDDKADFFAKDIRPSLTGVELVVHTPTGELSVHSPLLGLFNVANLIASIAAAMATGLSGDDIKQFVPRLTGAIGRMDRVPSQTGSFIVDYAHTPDALEQVLKSLKAHCTGKLWAVFGCGGDRDKGKRPLMTQVALSLADKVVLTADNPRSENPLSILKDMQMGMSCDDHYKTHIEPDRKTAIGYAVAQAKADDIVVIAGKGHETYQEINGVRYDFDDKQVLAQMIKQFGK